MAGKNNCSVSELRHLLTEIHQTINKGIVYLTVSEYLKGEECLIIHRNVSLDSNDNLGELI